MMHRDSRWPVIVGIHHGHDAGACVVAGGRVLADIAEERFTRQKHATDVPRHSLAACLKAGGLASINDADFVAISGPMPSLGLQALLGLPAVPVTIRDARMRVRGALRDAAARAGVGRGEKRITVPLYFDEFRIRDHTKVVFVGHHLAHAASAHFTRPEKTRCLVFTVDGSGDNVCTAVWRAEGRRIEALETYGVEAAIGYAYSAVTEALGWWHGDGEGKTMGLAPYGKDDVCFEEVRALFPVFHGPALTKRSRLSMPQPWYEQSATHYHMREARWIRGLIERVGSENVAAAAQRALEEVLTAFVLEWARRENCKDLAFAGGVFLNVKLNQRIWQGRGEMVRTQHIYPNCGDGGLAVGAALYCNALKDGPLDAGFESLYLGPSWSNEEVAATLRQFGVPFDVSANPSLVAAQMLADNKIIGWFQGMMESGPRALGNRSILMSPLRAENKDIINATVKFREGFRPFCPSLVREDRDLYLKDARDEFYMITSFDVTDEKRTVIPAVVHVDGTVRPQLVDRKVNQRYWTLIDAFGSMTGDRIVLNTSFNVRGEPIICSPADAVRCFFSSGLDALIIEDCVVRKELPPGRT